MLDTEKTAVLETAVLAYDALFDDLGPEASAAFKEAVASYLETGVAIPEVQSVSKATYYSNWNYHLIHSLEAKVSSTDLTGENEEVSQDAELAQFIANDLKIAAKIAAAVEQQYAAGHLAGNNTQIINNFKGFLTDDLSRLQVETQVLSEQYQRLSDSTHVDFDAERAQAIGVKLNTTRELITAAEDMQNGLSQYNSGDDITSFAAEQGDYLQLRIDALELSKQEKQAEYETFASENYTGSADLAEVAKYELEELSRESLDLTARKHGLDDIEQYDSTLRSASFKAGVNLLSTSRAAAAFAVNPENSVEGHVTNAGFLGEALLSSSGDLLEAAGHLNVSKGARGFAAVALVAGASGSFVPTAKLLADPDLSPEMRRVVEAEVGLQGTALAFAAVENVLGIAELAVTAGSKAATVLGKAVPIIGAIGSVIGAINPVKWAEFEQKQDRIDAIRDSGTYSSGLLGDLLQESKTAEAAFYGTTTALDVTTGVTAGVLAATGVGAPISAAVGLIGGAISAIVGAFEQVALEAIADRYADKIRTDAEGNPQTVEAFFKGSFDQKQERIKEHYTEFFEEFIAENDVDRVLALGGQGLDATDIELAAISKTSGELNKTARNYVETFTTNGWQPGSHALSPSSGFETNVIQLDKAHGSKSFLTFTTPLFAAGTEDISRRETGKNEYQTTLRIKDLSGWEIRDHGVNETTFNMSKVVSSAQDRFGNSMEIGIAIQAAAGDDALFAYEAQTSFDGGSGQDTASYARLSGVELAEGLEIRATGATTLLVEKNLSAGSKYFKESIDSQTTHHGKRTEVVQFRKVGLEERENQHAVTD
ncbi:bifunctional hemolysin-adenylate cyclase precursor [Roseobacter sp. SK209-2-6]|uniref:bifunctional hemolysin-adenylate cyclase precursor n=1 Tax=Roseobacter sp. SK209-2-6 TaxID=388739 RepID=UPI0000F3F7C2|nr:bifunctional hemolysin-adenylate cyclase precursor [Roseobacter sp. SK209-2-6]EBA18071.1 bifunctional hemolysin-adenylate cyclase precursor [Roseobacter sp. SK209-2-6]